MQPFNVAAARAAFALIAGCAGNASKVDTTANADDGLSGTPDQFNRITSPCIDQAARMTGLSRSQITITNRLRTGGGPLLTLDAGGTNYSCRLPPGSDNVAIYNSSSGDQATTVTLPKSGEYKIRVYLMGNDRDAGKTVGYNVDVSIQ
jgi:hypothetical protein